MKEQNIDTKLYPQAYLSAAISKQKENDVSPQAYLETEGDNFRSKVIYRVYKAYQEQLKRNNAMDFDDLLVNALHVLRDNPDILAGLPASLPIYSGRRVSGYQHTSNMRSSACSPRRIKISAWWGTTTSASTSGAVRISAIFWTLRKTFRTPRSSNWSRTTVPTVIFWRQRIPSSATISGRKSKKLWTDNEAGDKIVYRRCDNDKEEAYYIAQEIEYGCEDPRATYGDFAILYRTNAQSRLFEDALKKRGIPYQILVRLQLL